MTASVVMGTPPEIVENQPLKVYPAFEGMVGNVPIAVLLRRALVTGIYPVHPCPSNVIVISI